MATWKRLKNFLNEMKKVSDNRYGPGPTFWNDKDITGKYPDKSVLMKIMKDQKNKQ
jgi:hypothetical protein